jgi:hypothetical protein
VEQAWCMGVAAGAGSQGAFFFVLLENDLVPVVPTGTKDPL